MSTFAVLRVVVLLLVLVPLASAVLVPLFGRFARHAALLSALVHLGLTAAVVAIALPALDYRKADEATTPGTAPVHRFHPEFVPGDSAGPSGSDGRTRWTLLSLSTAEWARDKPGPNVQLFLGIDGLNLWLVALAAILMPVAILISWDAVAERPGAFYGWLFLLQAGLVGAFLSFDVILFYVFFELTLIPAFFLIGYWGVGSGRRDAARKFFLYTFTGSLLTLLGVIGIVVANPTPVHPQTGARMNLAVERSLIRPGQPVSDWVAARCGPVTFSLPDLMGNVQVWADAATVARGAAEQCEAEVAGERAALDQLRGAEGLVRAAEVAVPNPAAGAFARARRDAARPRADAARAALPGAERRLEAVRQMRATIDRDHAKGQSAQVWLFVALLAGFMVKVPIWPFHTWLPAAYGEAPIGVVVLLSAVMSKLGTFGILRLVLPLAPDAAIRYGLPVVGVLAAFGIVYAALCAYACRDIKLVFAYSSVSHLGFLVLGLFAFNTEGLNGAVLHMVNHGLSTGALFAALGFLVTRYRTTEQSGYGGLMGRFPHFALVMFVLVLTSIGLPGLNNVIGEWLMLGGLFDARNPATDARGLAAVAAVGVFLSAWYTLTVMRRVFFGPPKEPEPVVPGRTPGDMTRREFLAFGSLALLCVALGLLPQLLIEPLTADVRVLSIIGNRARARVADVPYVPAEGESIPVRPLPPPLTADPNAKGAPPGAKGGDPAGKGAPGKGGGKDGGGGKGGKGGGGKGGKDGGGKGVKGPLPPPLDED
jgi:NADH-quinone oxidoreductase subunit M